MNKKVPEITESAEDLKSLLRQSKKKHEIQRLNALYLLKSGTAKNRVEVAKALGVNRISVGTWLAAYKTGASETPQTRVCPGTCSDPHGDPTKHLT